jgi:hypothetical protein
MEEIMKRRGFPVEAGMFSRVRPAPLSGQRGRRGGSISAAGCVPGCQPRHCRRALRITNRMAMEDDHEAN